MEKEEKKKAKKVLKTMKYANRAYAISSIFSNGMEILCSIGFGVMTSLVVLVGLEKLTSKK